MAPPSTPAPSRFLLSKKTSAQSQHNGEQQRPSAAGRFRSTPRFSASSAPHLTPTPSGVGRMNDSSSWSRRGGFSTQDSIDSSPPESAPARVRTKGVDPIDLDSSPAAGSPRGLKRRCISISPDVDGASSQPGQSVLGDSSPMHEEIQGFDEGLDESDHHVDDGGEDEDEDELDLRLTPASDTFPDSRNGTINYDDSDGPVSDQDDDDASTDIAPTPLPRPQPRHACSSDSEDSSSPVLDFFPDKTKHPSSAHPRFNKAPRFKEAGATTDHDESGGVRGQVHALPDAFSPQRGGAKYVAGGLAAELRDWLIEVKGHDGGPGGTGHSVKKAGLAVESVRRGGLGMVLVQGRRVPPEGQGADEACDPVRAVLAGEGRISGLVRPKTVTVGCRVLVSPPAWDVVMGPRLERWTIACDWAVAETE